MKKNDAEILILITQFETPFSNEKWELLLKEIPENLQLKVKEYKQWRDYHASLLGNLLLKKMPPTLAAATNTYSGFSF